MAFPAFSSEEYGARNCTILSVFDGMSMHGMLKGILYMYAYARDTTIAYTQLIA